MLTRSNEFNPKISRLSGLKDQQHASVMIFFRACFVFNLSSCGFIEQHLIRIEKLKSQQPDY